MAKMITPQQSQVLHALLAKLGIMDGKAHLVRQFTNGRSSSSKDLTFAEAKDLIDSLNRQVPAKARAVHKPVEDERKAMFRKIYHMAHELGWEVMGTDLRTGKPGLIVDMERINNWCLAYGGFKKKLKEHSTEECRRLVTAFEQMYLKSI